MIDRLIFAGRDDLEMSLQESLDNASHIEQEKSELESRLLAERSNAMGRANQADLTELKDEMEKQILRHQQMLAGEEKRRIDEKTIADAKTSELQTALDSQANEMNGLRERQEQVGVL